MSSFEGPETRDNLIDMLGARFELVARMGNGENDTVFFRARMAANMNVPLHSHRDPECFYILSGKLDVFVADDTAQWRSLAAGESLIVIDGMKHALRNNADAAVDLILATNNRLASFFRAAGRTPESGVSMTPPTPEDIKRVVRTSEAYGYWQASPEESTAITG
jgi:quercetin dioxygenase-like cupin family protein